MIHSGSYIKGSTQGKNLIQKIITFVWPFVWPFIRTFVCLLICIFALGCASTTKKTTPELSQLQGKKVALVEIEGEPGSKAIVEVALINQLLQRGTFTIASKQEVEKARASHEINPLNWRAVAKKAGADYALRAKILEFDADTHEGYSEEEVEDSQLAKERGDDGKTKRIYKVKSMEGKVKVELEFTSLTDNDNRSGIASSSEKLVEEEKDGAIHFPPKMRFLEKLTNTAFHRFFEENQ